jgi:hypothetical protein
MENREKPNKLYKYVSLDTLKLILPGQTLKFSKPTDFNDPFDCDVDLLDFDFNSYINPRVVQEIEIIKEQFKNDRKFVSRTNDNLFWQEVYKGGQVEKINSCRVTCFSLRNDIVLMWSHYADKHNGVCLEFDNTFDKPFVKLSDEDISEGEVGYEAHQRINYVSEDRWYAIYKLFLNKSESWKHEIEYRMILINNKPELQEFNPQFLSAIYFGVKVSDSVVKSFISELCNSDFEHLTYYKAYKKNLSIKFHQIK